MFKLKPIDCVHTVWTVLYHPDVIPTVITVTGGVVSVISGYVLSRTYEKIKNGGNGNGHPPNGGENGAGD